MKSPFRLVIVFAAFATASVFAFAADNPSPSLDFGKIESAKNGDSVDIDLDEGLLGIAAQLAEGQEKEAAQLLRGLRQVRVRVIGMDDENRARVLERMHDIRTSLAQDGWKRVALVKDSGGADVAVFARVNGGNSIQGLAVTVIDQGKQAVIVHVTGEIKPEQITALGSRFDIDPLKKISFAKN